MTGDSLGEGLIAEGLAHHRAGRREEALELYAAGLKAMPDHSGALNLMGTALLELDRRGEARAYLERALGRDPRNPEILNNYGNLLAAEGEPLKARRHYEKALKLRPGYGAAWRNLARLCAKDRAPAEGLEAFRREVLRRRGDAEGHYTLGNLRQHFGALEEAVESFEAAAAADPKHVDAHYRLSILLHTLDRSEEAVVLLYKVLELDPAHGRAKHMRDAMEGRATRHAPESYVSELFDNYAPRYDKHLVEALGYRGPEVLRDAILAVADIPGADIPGAGAGSRPGVRFSRALDLGCGTGLVGHALAGMIGRLEGVDLSAKMIEKAEASGHYDDLKVGDIFEHLTAAASSETSAAAGAATTTTPFDLVVSGDVLLYIGDLDPLFAGLVPVMRPGGLFAFTVEELRPEKEERENKKNGEMDDAGDGYALRGTGRYQHRADYIESLAVAHGFAVLSLEPAVVRQQGGEPVPGLVAVLRLAGGSGG